MRLAAWPAVRLATGRRSWSPDSRLATFGIMPEKQLLESRRTAGESPHARRRQAPEHLGERRVVHLAAQPRPVEDRVMDAGQAIQGERPGQFSVDGGPGQV